MSREVRLAPEAVAEARDASRWYEEQTPGVGAALLDELAVAIADAGRWPGSGVRIEGVEVDREVRRLPVGRFPYHLVYWHTDDEVRVIAVAHDHREPGYWAQRAES